MNLNEREGKRAKAGNRRWRKSQLKPVKNLQGVLIYSVIQNGSTRSVGGHALSARHRRLRRQSGGTTESAVAIACPLE